MVTNVRLSQDQVEESVLARWAQGMTHSALKDMDPSAGRSDFISFALGLPETDFFPIQAFVQATITTLAENPASLQYSLVPADLKKHIAALMLQRGVICRDEQAFLTAGAQQGLSLLAHLLLNPGGKVLVEDTTYMGMLRVLTPFQPEIITVPTDREEGIDIDALEQLLQSGMRPAFLYIVVDGHNPLGISLNTAKRRRLADLAREYRMPIIEDDPYGFLSYEGLSLPPLRAFDEQWIYYVGSFSKTLAPALRLGWVILPENFLPHLSTVKDANDLDMATFAQYIAAAFLNSGQFPEHLSMLRQAYELRRDVMLSALQKNFSAKVHWRKPVCGLYIWVEFPQSVNTSVLLKRAIEQEEVAYAPGAAFCAGQNNYLSNCLRLCFSNCAPARIEEGISRLARVVKTVYKEDI